jgi:hypothetical protein
LQTSYADSGDGTKINCCKSPCKNLIVIIN